LRDDPEVLVPLLSHAVLKTQSLFLNNLLAYTTPFALVLRPHEILSALAVFLSVERSSAEI